MEQSDMINFEIVVKPQEDQKSYLSATSFPTMETAKAYQADPAKSAEAARKLAGLGAKIHHIGKYSISGACPAGRFEQLFKTKLIEIPLQRTDEEPAHYPKKRSFIAPNEQGTAMPPQEGELDTLVENILVQPEPIFFERSTKLDLSKLDEAERRIRAAAAAFSAAQERVLPPFWNDKFRLRVPTDVALLMGAADVHRKGHLGAGVRVAMPDTGFYHHPYFEANGYNFLAVGAPDTTHPGSDGYGHGTGECANLFATAPRINFIGVKMGNPTLAFKTAVDLGPQIMTNSWGYHLDFPNTSMPLFLLPLYLAILDAVASGITVCFSAGNGHLAFPANMPEVIAVGGVNVSENLKYRASDYASSFDSNWFPGRHVPDICGLVGMKPKADYIVLPVESGAILEKELGWGAFSGTSAASPMVAGVCALLKGIDPDLTPANIKNILRFTARDVVDGQSAHGQSAGPGWDPATGFGLVDAQAAVNALI